VTDRLASERSEQGLPPEHIEDDGVLARLAALVLSITKKADAPNKRRPSVRSRSPHSHDRQ
jgi:hypothetical protein